MRGDRPIEGVRIGNLYMATPHARGSTAQDHGPELACWGYPACAGIDRFLNGS